MVCQLCTTGKWLVSYVCKVSGLSVMCEKVSGLSVMCDGSEVCQFCVIAR